MQAMKKNVPRVLRLMFTFVVDLNLHPLIFSVVDRQSESSVSLATAYQ